MVCTSGSNLHDQHLFPPELAADDIALERETLASRARYSPADLSMEILSDVEAKVTSWRQPEGYGGFYEVSVALWNQGTCQTA